MRYIVQRYARYPIYEPAEGGYYYEGLGPDEDYLCFGTKATAIKALKKLVNRGNKEIKAYDNTGKELHELEGYVGISRDGTVAYTCNHEYIGDGYEYYVEPINRRGRHRKGWVPYQ